MNVICYIVDRGYSGYLPQEILEAGLKSGKYIQGHMNVNRSNASEEAFVRRKRYSIDIATHLRYRFFHYFKDHSKHLSFNS